MSTPLYCAAIFNIAAGSTGYHLVVDGHQYDDQYLAANSQGVFEKIFRVNDPYWQII
jgi:hypothetical protein